MEAASTSETSAFFYQTTRCVSQKTAIYILAAVRPSNPTYRKKSRGKRATVFCKNKTKLI
jgi:hypothetical protein